MEINSLTEAEVTSRAEGMYLIALCALKRANENDVAEASAIVDQLKASLMGRYAAEG